MLELFLVMVLLAFSAAGRIGSVYAAAPTCTTLSPTDITATSAIFGGSVNPNGKSTGAQFFGSHEIFGTIGMSPPQEIGSGVVEVPVSYTATGLTPSTNYYYWVGAANSDGSCHGATVNFTTLPAAVSTDWGVTSVSASPSSPRVGDPVIFSMTFLALSSSGSFPQGVMVGFAVDGTVYATGTFSYPGPTSLPATVSSETPWTATLGTHTLTGGVATIPAGNDPNTGNNVMSITFTVTQPIPFDFSLSASPNQQNVAPGGTASYTVAVNLVSGDPQSVTLSLTGATTGVAGSFSPVSGTPPFTSMLSVSATSAAVPGTITLTITGTGGGVTHQITITLAVQQAPDFQVNVDPSSQTVLQGQTVAFAVNVIALNGFNSQVSLTVSGLPSGTNGVFTVSSGSPNFASTLTVALPTDVPTGSLTLSVTGNGGGISHSSKIGLVINQALQSTSSSTQNTAGTSDIMSLVQKNNLLIIAILAIAIVAVLLSGQGRRTGPTTQTQQPQTTNVKYCSRCGAHASTADIFCKKCGTKLG